MAAQLSLTSPGRADHPDHYHPPFNKTLADSLTIFLTLSGLIATFTQLALADVSIKFIVFYCDIGAIIFQILLYPSVFFVEAIPSGFIRKTELALCLLSSLAVLFIAAINTYCVYRISVCTNDQTIQCAFS